MLKYIVTWRFKEGLTAEERQHNAQQMKKTMDQLKSVIPEIVSLDIVINPLSESNVDIALVSTFKDEAALAVYQLHEAHQAAVKKTMFFFATGYVLIIMSNLLYIPQRT